MKSLSVKITIVVTGLYNSLLKKIINSYMNKLFIMLNFITKIKTNSNNNNFYKISITCNRIIDDDWLNHKYKRMFINCILFYLKLVVNQPC